MSTPSGPDSLRKASIIIHFGPPKTGTSAIQQWLHDQRDSLLKQGIYYPEHKIDSNGVSSGNHKSILDVDKQGVAKLNVHKVKHLLRQQSSLGASQLLLSSEYFYELLPTLGEAFPDALFVGYVRSPLDVMQSGYNQGVKRHGKTQPLLLKRRVNAAILMHLIRYVEQMGPHRFLLKAYAIGLFPHNNIVQDFAATLGLPFVPNESPLKPVNTSYSFEAMEVKRVLNGCPGTNLHKQLDSVLQNYQDGIQGFSIIAPDMYEQYREQSVNVLLRLKRIAQVENIGELVARVRRKKQPDYLTQELNSSQAEKVMGYLSISLPQYTFAACLKFLAEQADNDEPSAKALVQASKAYMSQTQRFKLDWRALLSKLSRAKLGIKTNKG